MKSPILALIVNLGLLISGLLMAFTGLLIQFGYHMGNHGAIDSGHVIIGLSYPEWSWLHRIIILFVSGFMILHILRHWKWYKTVIRKKLVAKNRQVLILSVLFLLVAVTGFTPWLICSAGGSEDVRKLFIEVHDKLTLVLLVFLILHLSRRFKWYLAAFRNAGL